MFHETYRMCITLKLYVLIYQTKQRNHPVTVLSILNIINKTEFIFTNCNFSKDSRKSWILKQHAKLTSTLCLKKKNVLSNFCNNFIKFLPIHAISYTERTKISAILVYFS